MQCYSSFAEDVDILNLEKNVKILSLTGKGKFKHNVILTKILFMDKENGEIQKLSKKLL